VGRCACALRPSILRIVLLLQKFYSLTNAIDIAFFEYCDNLVQKTVDEARVVTKMCAVHIG